MPEMFLLDADLRLTGCVLLDRPLTVRLGEGEAEAWTSVADGLVVQALYRTGYALTDPTAILVPKVLWHQPLGEPMVLAAQPVTPLAQPPRCIQVSGPDRPGLMTIYHVGALTPATEAPRWLRRVLREAGDTLAAPDTVLVGPFRRRDEQTVGFGGRKGFRVPPHAIARTQETPFIGMWKAGSLLRLWSCPSDWTERASSPLDLPGVEGRRARKQLKQLERHQ